MKSKFKLLSSLIAVLLLLQCLFINNQPIVHAAETNIPDILITEVMPYSQNTNDAYEYIELYNNSSNTIDLKDYKFALPYVDISASKLIAPKNVLVICTRNTSLKDFNSFYGTTLTDNNYLSLAQADLLSNTSSGCVIIAKDDGKVIALANYTYNDFSEKKSVIFQYQPSYEMKWFGRNQNPSPGTLSSGQVPYEGVKVTGITLDKRQLTMGLNTTYKLIAAVSPETATNKNVTWTSDNVNVATVDSSGTVASKGIGSTTITAVTSDGNLKAYCYVSVIAAAGIALDKSSITIDTVNPVILIPTVTPTNIVVPAIKWSSSNNNIATVNDKGIVKGVSGGTAVITASIADNIYATCTVYVNGPSSTIPVTGIFIKKTNLSMVVGNMIMLEAYALPYNATNKNVTWASSNTNVVSVDDYGILNAKSIGYATITAKTVEGGYTATCNVIVKSTADSVAVTSIKLNKIIMTINEGKSEKLNAIIKPDNATNKVVTWVSSNNNCATVDQYGNVKGIKEGYSIITVTTSDGVYTSYCLVIVKKPESAKIAGIKLNKKVLYLSTRKSEKLIAMIVPGNLKQKFTITWSSSDETIAIVKNGIVTGKKNGIVIITASCNGKSATCVVYVGSQKGKGHFK